MRKRLLGDTGLNVPVIMLGGNVFGWTMDEAASFDLLDRAVDAGLNFIDTADVYSSWVPGHTGGESETILGNWLKKTGKRDQVILATKVGIEKGLAPNYIQEAVEDSLRRLQTDHIDLYQAHKDDPKTPLEHTLGAFDRLIQQGKVRFIGASNYSGARLREALEVSKGNGLPAYQTLQPHYNLLEREEYEADLAPVAQEYGLGIIPYFSLASGFLTGKYRSKADLAGKTRGGMVEKYLNDRGLNVLHTLDSIAQTHDSTPARVALAWLLTRPGITAPIASATTTDQLNELVEASRLTLERSSIEKLSAVSAAATA